VKIPFWLPRDEDAERCDRVHQGLGGAEDLPGSGDLHFSAGMIQSAYMSIDTKGKTTGT
jgi:hypothetical protein